MTESGPPPSASDGARLPAMGGDTENEGREQPDTWAQSPFNPRTWCPAEMRTLAITFYGTVGGTLATAIIVAAAISIARQSTGYTVGGATAVGGALLLGVGFFGYWSEKPRWQTSRWRKAFQILALCGLGALCLGVLDVFLVLLGRSAHAAS